MTKHHVNDGPDVNVRAIVCLMWPGRAGKEAGSTDSSLCAIRYCLYL